MSLMPAPVACPERSFALRWILQVFEMVALLPRGDIYSTALLSVAVDARDFSMVGYPPYHDHHSGMTITGAYDFDQLLLNHQDNNCVASDGKPGELCGIPQPPVGLRPLKPSL
jgi:hypothetical protein